MSVRPRLKILTSAHTVYIRVLCGSENKERLCPYTTVTDWLFQPKRGVFTARYELHLYVFIFHVNQSGNGYCHKSTALSAAKLWYLRDCRLSAPVDVRCICRVFVWLQLEISVFTPRKPT